MIVTAGIPPWYGRDYHAAFRDMAAANIRGYMALDLLYEVPERFSNGRESDFLPPPYGTGDGLDAMRQHGVGLILSANTLWPPHDPFPSHDPLSRIWKHVHDLVLAFANYDEPIHNSVSPERSAEAFRRFREHGQQPVLQAFLRAEGDWRAYGQDILGITAYPVQPFKEWEDLTPYVDHLQAEYPGKQHFGLLQAFGVRNLYSPEARAEFDQETIDAARPPTRCEMERMVSELDGVHHHVWWGASYLDNDDRQVWQDVLAVSRCIG